MGPLGESKKVWGAIAILGLAVLGSYFYTGNLNAKGGRLSDYLQEESNVPLGPNDSTPFYQWIKDNHGPELDQLAISGRDLTKQVMILSADLNSVAQKVGVTTTAINEVRWPGHDRHLPPPPPPDW